MLKVFKSFMCFSNSKVPSDPSKTRTTQPIAEFQCEACNHYFSSKSIYKQHKLNKCTSMGSQRPCSETTETRKTRMKDQDTQTSESFVKGTTNANDEGEIQKRAPFMRSYTIGTTGPKSTTIKVYFRDNRTTPPKLSKMTIEEIELQRIVEMVKAKDLKQRRDYELKFLNKYRKGKSCTTYGISEEWIEKLEDFLNGRQIDPPGPIDNSNMKEKLLNKEVPQNTYSVNELLWKFLQSLYGGGPEITYTEKPSTIIMNDLDRLSEARTNDTWTRSEAVDSMRSSILDMPKSIELDAKNPLMPIKIPNPNFYCYMNACLQALLGITKLVNFVAHGVYKNKVNTKHPKFWPAISEVVQACTNKDEYLTPRVLKKLSRNLFDPSQQHDAHEFLNFLMSGMQGEINVSSPHKYIKYKDSLSAWNNYKKYNTSIIDELFAGQYASKVTCGTCRNVSTTYDPFLDVSLPIAKNNAKRAITLDDCLAAFQNEEEIVDAYRCPSCQTKQRAIKKLSLDQFPNHLVVQLKRFQTYPRKEKIFDHVKFPVDLWTIKAYDSRETFDYTLKAVISHFGPIDSGHYVCFTKREEEWFLCDDEDVIPVSSKDVFMGEAYVLIYQSKE